MKDEHKCNCDESCECNQENCTCQHDTEQNQPKKKRHEKKDALKEAQLKVQQLEEEVLRSKADLVNYRKRKDEEVGKMLNYCNEDIVKDLLPTIDNFERAIKLDDDNLDDELSKFLEGFKMIYCNMISIMEQYGVKAIDGDNKQFDPTYHQAVLTEKKEGVEPGMVLEVLQKGYLLKDRVIRPAMVKVSI